MVCGDVDCFAVVTLFGWNVVCFPLVVRCFTVLSVCLLCGAVFLRVLPDWLATSLVGWTSVLLSPPNRRGTGRGN